MNYAHLQAELRDMSKKDAVNRLHSIAEAKSRSWCERNLHRLMDLDQEAFARSISYTDPTGNTAVRNVMTKNNGPGTVTKQFSEAVQPTLLRGRSL